MWLSKQMGPLPPDAGADLGVTTIAGDSVGAAARGEIRALPIFGPGGFVWLPESGAEVLVIKGGPGGTERCVAGTRQGTPPAGLRPGEICLQGGDGKSAITLKKDGTVEIKAVKLAITGDVIVNGKAWTEEGGE